MSPDGLSDGVVVLRRWDERDLTLLERAGRDEYVATIEHMPRPWDEERGREWIDRQRAETRGWALAVEEAGNAVGGVGIARRHSPGVAGLGYWIVEPERGRGLAERAARLMCTWALTGAAEIARVEATVEPWNAPSIRVLEKVGFVREGLLRSYASWNDERRDVLIYSLLPQDVA
jgi:RimJ/RimL family protein N-acetyltransferase